jgi:hypothetical protein
MAKIIVKGTEKVLVLNIREALVYQAVVPNWLDVRIGAYISATKAANDDDPTGLAETVTTTGAEQDRFWLGAKESGNSMPRSAGSFIGWSNSPATEANGSTVLESIDTAFRWRTKYATSTVGLLINDGTNIVADTSLQPPRVIQAPASLGNHYATLVMMRLVRSTVGSTLDNFYVAKSNSGGVDYGDSGIETDTPTIQSIRDAFRSATFTEYLPGGHTFSSALPDCFYAYWPFANSRLRIHAIVVEKFS